MTGTTGPFGIKELTEAIGDVERVAHGPPDDLRILAIGQRLVYGTPTEARQNVIFRKALGVHVTELLFHPRPEFRQPHGTQATGRGLSRNPQATEAR